MSHSPYAAAFAEPAGSPIRELFPYLSRPGMISFAGGYPRRRCWMAPASNRPRNGSSPRAPASCSTARPRAPGAARGAGAALRRARYRGEARGHPGDHGLATGFRPAGARVRGTRRRGLCGIALLSGDAAGAAPGRRAHRAGAGGRPGHADRCAGNAAGERAGRCLAQAHLHRPDLLQPLRHAVVPGTARAAGEPGGAARRGRGRGRSLRRAALRPRRSSRSTRWARGCRRPIR